MIRFSKYIWLYIVISGIVLIPGMYSLIRFGLRPSVDFSGGTLVEFRADVPAETITSVAAQTDVSLISIQKAGNNSYLLRLKQDGDEFFLSSISGAIVRKETVGPTLGGELLRKTLYAAFFAIVTILLYIAWSFKNIRFGVAAVVALVHDLLVVLGSFSLFGHFLGVEVDTLFVTAVLTTMSFSVHDTIVVFDRIREYTRRDRPQKFEEIADVALTETMNRSLTNSFTIIFMLVALILMGGETTKWFVVALLIGTISGTYSSPFVATPVLLLWQQLAKPRK